ncbi:MAG: hypothetical protein QG555_393 [Thermodesulfobacteriota bacterium]|nr:hypothetical protein [Thermodesulfobacteriota bacterium]
MATDNVRTSLPEGDIINVGRYLNETLRIKFFNLMIIGILAGLRTSFKLSRQNVMPTPFSLNGDILDSAGNFSRPPTLCQGIGFAFSRVKGGCVG